MAAAPAGGGPGDAPSGGEEAVTLAALSARRKSSGLAETVDIDVSRWYGEGATLTLRRLSVADKWMASRERAKAIQSSRPHWPREISVIVSTLASAHVAPDSGKAGPIPFYRDLADDTDESLLWHIQEQYLAFADSGASGAQEGISETEADKVLLYCCLTYLHRHPSELDNLDASAMDDLLATYRRELEEKQALVKHLGPLAALIGLTGGKGK